MDDLIERVAGAIHDIGPDASPENYAQAALKAIQDAGYVIAPVEPTEAMIEAGDAVVDDSWGVTAFLAGHTYQAMIQAIHKGE